MEGMASGLHAQEKTKSKQISCLFFPGKGDGRDQILLEQSK